jgi:hypothetical protein
MSKYNPEHNAIPIFDVSARWATTCHLDDGSISSDGQRLWTLEQLDELDRAFVQNYDEGEGSFLEKL